MARVINLVDEAEDSEAQQPFETALGPILIVSNPDDESNVKVIEASLVKKMKLLPPRMM